MTLRTPLPPAFKDALRAIALPLGLGLVSLGLVACSGDDGDAGPTSAPTDEVTAPAKFMAAPPASLDSYAYAVSITISPDAIDSSEAPAGLNLGDDNFTFQIDGTVVNPDREHSTTVANLGFLSLTLESIQIGMDEWTKQDDGGWQPSTAGDPLAVMLGDTDFSPGAIFTADEGYSFEDLTARLEAHGYEEDEVDGRAARHFTFTDEEFYAVFQTDREVLPAELNATMTADLWIAEDLGVPLKMEIVGADVSGTQILQIDMALTDLNGAFTIEPPV
jgi:hypothetical protein